MRIDVRSDPAAVAETAAELIREELAVPGPATLGLAGGSTPEATYDLLARRDVDWEQTTLWLGDERWVPPDDPESNTRMAREHLGEEAADRLLAPDYARGDPQRAAAEYEAELLTLFANAGGRPDTVLLGMGPDGHTASLFPDTEALEVEDRLYVAHYVPKLDSWRLSATISLLASARHLVYLVTGEAKADVVAEILDDAAPYPARLVAERAPEVTWILDEAAASSLR